jgi:hypothetical protein
MSKKLVVKMGKEKLQGIYIMWGHKWIKLLRLKVNMSLDVRCELAKTSDNARNYCIEYCISGQGTYIC